MMLATAETLKRLGGSAGIHEPDEAMELRGGAAEEQAINSRVRIEAFKRLTMTSPGHVSNPRATPRSTA
jgi:hypothetical protein